MERTSILKQSRRSSREPRSVSFYLNEVDMELTLVNQQSARELSMMDQTGRDMSITEPLQDLEDQTMQDVTNVTNVTNMTNVTNVNNANNATNTTNTSSITSLSMQDVTNMSSLSSIIEISSLESFAKKTFEETIARRESRTSGLDSILQNIDDLNERLKQPVDLENEISELLSWYKHIRVGDELALKLFGLNHALWLVIKIDKAVYPYGVDFHFAVNKRDRHLYNFQIFKALIMRYTEVGPNYLMRLTINTQRIRRFMRRYVK